MDQGKTLQNSVAALKLHNPQSADLFTVDWDHAFANWRQWKVESVACSSYRSFEITHGARWRHTMAAINGHPLNACKLFEAAKLSTLFDYDDE